MRVNDLLHDSYKILASRPNYSRLPSAIMHSVHGQVGVKMLNVYRDGREYHYKDVWKQVIPGKRYGNYSDLWRSLVYKSRIAFSSKHAYGTKYYRITPYGSEILSIADANQVYYRIARWFKAEGDDFFTNMLNADLNGEESYKDLMPESFIALLEQLFNPSSKLRQIGSAYRWMNNYMNLLKSSDEFYEKATNPEVMAWIEASRNRFPEIENYLKVFSKIQKKRMKNATNKVNIA